MFRFLFTHRNRHILRTFQKKVAEVQSQIQMREEKGLVRDPMLDTAYQDLESLRDQLQQAQEKLFDVGLYISIYGETDAELDKIESEIKSILESKLVYVKAGALSARTRLPQYFADCQRRLVGQFQAQFHAAFKFFPFISFDLTSDKGILYGINRHNSSLVLVRSLLA
jgi:conjugal transfer ATP-binding protein TraC